MDTITTHLSDFVTGLHPVMQFLTVFAIGVVPYLESHDVGALARPQCSWQDPSAGLSGRDDDQIPVDLGAPYGITATQAELDQDILDSVGK